MFSNNFYIFIQNFSSPPLRGVVEDVVVDDAVDVVSGGVMDVSLFKLLSRGFGVTVLGAVILGVVFTPDTRDGFGGNMAGRVNNEELGVCFDCCGVTFVKDGGNEEEEEKGFVSGLLVIDEVVVGIGFGI